MTKPDVFIAKLPQCQYPDDPFHPPEFYSEFNNSGLIPEIETYPLTQNSPGSITIKANCSDDDYHFKFLTPAGWKGIYDTYKSA